MHATALSPLLLSALFTAFATGARADELPPSPAPQAQEALKPMIDVEWSAGTHMPQGMQDNHVNVVGNSLVSVLGFCSGADDDWKPGKYPRGFLNKAWALDLEDESAAWVSLPPFPGTPRQGGNGASVEGALYLWGGFSYDAPYTYTDGYKLSRKNDTWQWEALPPLPSPSCWTGMAVVGKKIYALGGADYDAQAFYCLRDRTGTIQGLGQRVLMFDTEHPESGWSEKTKLPGTPRCLVGTPVVEGKMYVVGGITMLNSGGYANVVDNWRYDPEADSWERLRDHPLSATGSSSSTIVYGGRYLLLPAGYQYGVVLRPDGTEAPAYGTPQTVTRTWQNHPGFETTHYYNHHFVYDTRTDNFGTATPLPFDDVSSITVVLGDTAYLFPGETGGFYWEGEYFGHHPEFVLKGRLTTHAAE